MTTMSRGRIETTSILLLFGALLFAALSFYAISYFVHEIREYAPPPEAPGVSTQNKYQHIEPPGITPLPETSSLSSSQERKAAALIITTIPHECHISISRFGEQTAISATSDHLGNLTMNNLLPGRYLVEASRHNYQTQYLNIQLTPGQTKELKIVLEELASPQADENSQFLSSEAPISCPEFDSLTADATRLASEGRFREAIQTLSRALAALPQDVDTTLLKARVFGTRLYSFENQPHEINCVAFSPDGNLIAFGARDVTLVCSNELSVQKKLIGHLQYIGDVAFNPSGDLIASAGRDARVIIWNASTGKAIHTFREHTAYATCVAFSPDGDLVASAGFDQRIIVRNIQAGTTVATFTGHGDAIRTIAFTKDGRKLLTGSYDDTIKIWNLETKREEATLQSHTHQIWALDVSPDGRFVASGSSDRSAKVWDITALTEIASFPDHPRTVISVRFSPDGRYLVTGTYKMITLWDLKTGLKLKSFQAHENWVDDLAFSPDGKLLVSTSRDKTIKVWWAGMK